MCHTAGQTPLLLTSILSLYPELYLLYTNKKKVKVPKKYRTHFAYRYYRCTICTKNGRHEVPQLQNLAAVFVIFSLIDKRKNVSAHF